MARAFACRLTRRSDSGKDLPLWKDLPPWEEEEFDESAVGEDDGEASLDSHVPTP